MNKQRLIVYLLVTVFTIGLTVGCPNGSNSEKNPLAGFRGYRGDNFNQAITKDYKDFIQQLNANGLVGPVMLYENGEGLHVVNFEVFEHNINASWHYAIIYGKDDKRLKVIKYGYRKYMS
jgi:hypothetical protein